MFIAGKIIDGRFLIAMMTGGKPPINGGFNGTFMIFDITCFTFHLCVLNQE